MGIEQQKDGAVTGGLRLPLKIEGLVILSASLFLHADFGFDRMLGYGLKYSEGFKFTHLGIIGK